MDAIRYIDWNKDEIEGRTTRLRQLGYSVEAAVFDNLSLQKMKAVPPAAVVISLDRRPSQGRDIAMLLRKTRATRFSPLVLVGGHPDKVQDIREHLPDAVYTDWETIGEALQKAIENPPSDPVVPGSLFDPYRGTPLPKKLGIRAGSLVLLLDAPDNFPTTLGELPENVNLQSGSVLDQPGQDWDTVIWFVRQQVELDRQLAETARLALQGKLWIVWPKKTSGVRSDLSQPSVRAAGLALGMVDYKVCSVDQTWTGLCFRWRQEA